MGLVDTATFLAESSALSVWECESQYSFNTQSTSQETSLLIRLPPHPQKVLLKSSFCYGTPKGSQLPLLLLFGLIFL